MERRTIGYYSELPERLVVVIDHELDLAWTSPVASEVWKAVYKDSPETFRDALERGWVTKDQTPDRG